MGSTWTACSLLPLFQVSLLTCASADFVIAS